MLRNLYAGNEMGLILPQRFAFYKQRLFIHQPSTRVTRQSSDNGALCPGQTGVAPPEKRVSRRQHRHIMNVIVRPAIVGFFAASLAPLSLPSRRQPSSVHKEIKVTQSVVVLL